MIGGESLFLRKFFRTKYNFKKISNDYPERWITWLVGRWRTQLIARQLVNCRTHEHRHFERTLRSTELSPGPRLAEGRSIKTTRLLVEYLFICSTERIGWAFVGADASSHEGVSANGVALNEKYFKGRDDETNKQTNKHTRTESNARECVCVRCWQLYARCTWFFSWTRKVTRTALHKMRRARRTAHIAVFGW